MIFIVIVLILVIYCVLYKMYLNEQFTGGLLQLYAKGPEDAYLTYNTEKYIPEYRMSYYWPYHESVFNNPTRMNYYYYPLHGNYPNDYYIYPYYWS